jgi:succinoglycan biosynthesis transport protein ExoP
LRIDELDSLSMTQRNPDGESFDVDPLSVGPEAPSSERSRRSTDALSRSRTSARRSNRAATSRSSQAVTASENDFAPPTAGYRGNYRDYRNGDYRGMDYRDNAPIGDAEGQIDWASALWRYRFALLLPALLGLALGGAFFTTRPNIYRSTARLVVESDRPWTPDAGATEAANAVPPAELLLMQLRSQQVIDYAVKHPLMADAMAKMSPGQLAGVLSAGVAFQDAMTKSRSDRALAFFLHFEDQDPQFAINAVTVLSDGLQNFFAERSETSVAELKRLITTAKDKLLPELNALEQEYRVFRENSELSWDQSGEMINPYREKQLALQTRRLSLEDEQRDLSTKLAAITNTIESTQDPLLVMEVVQQLLGEELFAVRQLLNTEESRPALNTNRDEDLSLAKLTVERTLLPLEVERQQFASQFGAGHPSVRQLDQQIAATREKLNELTAQETRRLSELRKEGESPSGELVQIRLQRAELAVSGFVKALETRRTVLMSQISQLDAQIDTLSDKATKLARAESENEMFIRRIGRQQKLFDSVEEQMAKINLSNQDAAIHVSQLNAPSAPALVSPILSKFLAVGGMLGAMAGLGLVYLLESQSKTYRSSDEIATTLGLRVLSHVPTDSHKLPKVTKGAIYAYQGIDPGLSAVHRPRSATSEAIRRLRTGVFFDANATDAKVIQITSPLPEDGKSTLAGNLAVSIARSGKSVVIVDADMRRPQMTSSFGMEQRRGLSELIDGTCDPSQVVHPTPIENLYLVPCGPIPANPAEALSMHQFSDFLYWLRDRYDYVIVDTPPLLVVTDPAIVASAVDGIVFTFRVRRGCRPQTKEAVTMLRSTGTPIFGCVVNRVDHNTTSTGYQGYQASSYYGRRYSAYSADKNQGNGERTGEFVINPRSVAIKNPEFESVPSDVS